MLCCVGWRIVSWVLHICGCDPDNSTPDCQFPLLDVALTSWNFRDKKLPGLGLSFIRPDEVSIPIGESDDLVASVADQAKYKFIVYVEGHVPGASSRYTCLLQTGSVILKVTCAHHVDTDINFLQLLFNVTVKVRPLLCVVATG